MAIRIQLRRDTSANWESANPVLRAGEIGIETDTLKFKIGNGTDAWNSITAYANIVPGDLNSTLSEYVLVTDIGDTVAGLNGDQNLIIPNDSIIFEGATPDAYELTLVSPDVTEDKTITLPNATTTLVGTDTTDTLTNKTITSPVISGLALSDASIVFEGAVADSYETTLTVGEPTDDRVITLPNATGTVALTTDIPSTTDGLNEGATNKYYTDERSVDATAAALAAGTHTNITVSYNDEAGSISLTGAQTYSDEQAQDAVAAALEAGTHTNITVTYNDSSNSISLAAAPGYTDEQAQDAVGNVVGNGLDYDDDTGAISVDPSEFALSAVGAPTSNISLNSYKITSLAAPTDSADAANKSYVDNTASGIVAKPQVLGATTANIDATYNNGTLGVGATLTHNTNGVFPSTAGGATGWSVGKGILVKNQTNKAHNGRYFISDMGSESTPYVLTRCGFCDEASEIPGAYIFVQSGTNAGTGWIQVVADPATFVVGTDNIDVYQFSGSGTYTAGTGLTLSGTEYSINTAVTVDLNTAQTLTNKTITGTFTGNLTGNADTVTNGVVTTGSYADPSWITSLAASKVGLGNVENTALSTWAGSTNITTLGTIATGTWNATTIGTTKGGTGLTSYATGDILYASASNTLSKLTAGTNGHILTLSSGVPIWAAAPISLPTQSGNSGKYLTTDGTTASWQTLNSATPSIRGVLFGLSDASSNSSVGQLSLNAITTGYNNTAVGSESSRFMTSGFANVSVGRSALYSNTSGNTNTAVGIEALYTNTTGNGNTALGRITLKNNNSSFNTAVGDSALTNVTSQSNTAVGRSAGILMTTGGFNTAVGENSASNITTGTNNLNLGYNALASSATASNEITLGNSNITRFRVPGLGIDWTTAPIVRGSETINQNTATTIDTNALSSFTSAEYVLSLKQGSKVRTSKILLQTDGTNVDMTEFAITETGGLMSGVAVTATASGGNSLLNVTVTDAASTNVVVKFSEIKI